MLYSNLRLHTGDGTKLLACLPDHSVHAILVTFPDPFVNQVGCRLLQVSVLEEIWRVLVPQGRLYLATDHAGYHAWSQVQVELFNQQQQQQQQQDDTTKSRCFRLVEPTPDRRLWLPVVSKYEQKGWDEGRSTHLSCWEAIDK